ADLVLVCLCPPELEALAAERSILPAGRVNAGLWIWDVDPLPASWPTSPHRFDEIWSPTSYVTGLLAPVVQLPVFTAPPGLQPPRSEGTSSLLEPGRATVLVLADVASSLARKNPAGAIEAFARAFRPDEGARVGVKIWPPTGRTSSSSTAGSPAGNSWPSWRGPPVSSHSTGQRVSVCQSSRRWPWGRRSSQRASPGPWTSSTGRSLTWCRPRRRRSQQESLPIRPARYGQSPTSTVRWRPCAPSGRIPRKPASGPTVDGRWS